MIIEIRESAFDPWFEISQFEKGDHLKPGSYGACATFVGTMRDLNFGDQVESMHLQHYEGMTEKLLADEALSIQRRSDLLEFLILHRVGEIKPNDPIVLVAAWSAHRAAAFDGCRELMEYLKSNATFWKKETLQSSTRKSHRWVDNKSN